MNFLDALKEINNYTVTENGAVAYKSTGNAVLDAFGTMGSYNRLTFDDKYLIDSALEKFYKAWSEDRTLAMKLLFYLRDIRGGQGCRTLFRVIMITLANYYPEYVINNFNNFLLYGRGDDLLYLLDTPIEKDVIEYIGQVLSEDIISVGNGGTCSLLAKWLPSENASSKQTKYFANKLIKGLDMKPSEYRRILSKLRKSINIVETQMSQNKWEEIDFDKLPSKASMLYSNAFYNHVKEAYTEYLNKLALGNSKINAGTLVPVDIIHKIFNGGYYPIEKSKKDIILYDALWKALPNYFEEADKDETGICVVDTSGSMLGTPIEVAISLGLYCADKAKGPFKNHFITFSHKPELQEIKGSNIFEKVSNMSRAGWDMNTNLEAVFELILETAVKNNLSQDELPNKLYIISDMQFDDCAVNNNYEPTHWWEEKRNINSNKTLSFMESMRDRYAEYDYILPAIVFWNVRTSNCGMFQQTIRDEQCCFVSGYSPSLFKAVLLGTEYSEEINDRGEEITRIKLDPMTIMLNTLNNERYNKVWVGEGV